MKKYLYILTAAVIALSLSSCEKILDTESPSAFDAKSISIPVT